MQIVLSTAVPAASSKVTFAPGEATAAVPELLSSPTKCRVFALRVRKKFGAFSVTLTAPAPAELTGKSLAGTFEEAIAEATVFATCSVFFMTL